MRENEATLVGVASFESELSDGEGREMDVERVVVLPGDREGLVARLRVECPHCGEQLADHGWLAVHRDDKGTIMKAGMRRVECCSECTERHVEI